MNKSSYIQWLGNIPDGWEVVKVREVFTERNVKVFSTEYQPLSVTKDGIQKQLDNVALSNTDGNRKLVKVGDYVVNSRSDRKGSCGVSPYEGSVSFINIVLEPSNKIDKNYIHHLFRSNFWVEEFYRNGHGIVADLWSTHYCDMRNMSLPLPPLSVQHRISSYLDEKTELINRLIETRTAQIDKLKQYRAAVVSSAVTKGLNPNRKMKNSNIQWIGDIPEDWEVVKLGKVLILNPGKKNIDDNIPVSFMPMECLRNGIIKRKIALYKDVEKYTPFMENDVVMAKVTPCFENGNIAIAKDLENGLGFGTSEIYVFRCSNHIKNSYLFYLLQSNYIIRIGVASMSGTGGLKRVKSEVLKNAAIPLPPLSEQRSIVSYLDAKVSEINKLIKVYDDEIAKMKNYKNSLVSAVVTGQIAV